MIALLKCFGQLCLLAAEDESPQKGENVLVKCESSSAMDGSSAERLGASETRVDESVKMGESVLRESPAERALSGGRRSLGSR